VAAPKRASAYNLWEDLYGLGIASLLISVGANLLHAAGLTTGGTVGLSLVLAQAFQQPYALWFCALNLPLFAVGLRVLGTTFIFKSLVVTAATAAISVLIPRWMSGLSITPLFAAVAGGTIVGMGALASARHGAAAGGTLVIVLWLQRRFGFNAGFAQLVIDLTIVSISIAALGWAAAAQSVVAIFATDAMIAAWYRPGDDTGHIEAVGPP
jgi:uncharacterized membrane-anchored protein YitT (DUF2179 family)